MLKTNAPGPEQWLLMLFLTLRYNLEWVEQLDTAQGIQMGRQKMTVEQQREVLFEQSWFLDIQEEVAAYSLLASTMMISSP